LEPTVEEPCKAAGNKRGPTESALVDRERTIRWWRPRISGGAWSAGMRRSARRI